MLVRKGNKPWQNPILSHVHFPVSIGNIKGHRNSSVEQQHGLWRNQAIIIFAEKPWALLCVTGKKEKAFCTRWSLTLSFENGFGSIWKSNHFALSVEGTRNVNPRRFLSSGMSHCGPSQAHPFCGSGRHLRNWSCSTLCPGGGGIHLHSENLCFYWFLNIAVSEHKTSYLFHERFFSA